MSRAILKTLRIVSLRKTGPWRLLRILLTLETSSPTRRAISTCVIIDPSPETLATRFPRGTGHPEDKGSRGACQAYYGLFTHKPVAEGAPGAGRAQEKIRFCLRAGSISIVITHLFAGVRRHDFWG